jgi:glutamine amidotransferase
VAINTAAVRNPELIKKAAEVFGSSTIVLSVEAKKIGEGKWEAYVDNGREQTGLDVVAWVQKAVALGAGEVLITSVDQEGMRSGYDTELIEAVTSVVTVPVIASGGAGTIEHIEECMRYENLDGIAIASLLHYNELDIRSLKDRLKVNFPGKIKQGIHENLKPSFNNDRTVSIVDYNLGNIKSVTNALKQIGVRSFLVDAPQAILGSQYLILPGVGSFGEGMKHLRNRRLDQAIVQYASSGKPLMGICLGMQLLMSRSYEFGEHQGLDLIKGEVMPFTKDHFGHQGVKIPHVGWNKIYKNFNWDNTILKTLTDGQEVYFVHSFVVCPDDPNSVMAVTKYFDYEFCSAIKKDNIYGCQFHPEKSGQAGLSILKEFMSIGQNEGVVHAG